MISLNPDRINKQSGTENLDCLITYPVQYVTEGTTRMIKAQVNKE